MINNLHAWAMPRLGLKVDAVLTYFIRGRVSVQLITCFTGLD